MPTGQLVRERLDCRLCGGDLKGVFSLTPTPIANSFPDKPDHAAERYPLELMQCRHCKHVQLKHVLTRLFEDYKYSTPKSAHHKDAAKNLRKNYPEARTVLEIGSNNGLYLRALKDENFIALGVDPAAEGPGNKKVYFTSGWAERLGQKFDLVVANNVLAHIDDIRDTFAGIQYVLAPEGSLVFENQYLPDMIAHGTFDMIYHEHMDYHTLIPLAGFLRRQGLVMVDWEHLDAHGGSIRVTARRKGKPAHLPDENLNWQWFAAEIDRVKQRVHRFAPFHEPLVAFGAAAKACTFINHLGLEPYLSYVVDDTPKKQGRYIPGTDLKIKPVESLGDETVLLTAWNYEKEIRARLPTHRLFNPFQ